MSLTRHSLERAPSRSRAGFTLIELIVALLVGGILTTVVFQILQGNSRFVALQTAREEVQQNGRAGLDLIAGELRAAPAAALLEFEPRAVRFYMPRSWGVLCNPLSGTSTQAWVLFPPGVFPAQEFRWQAPHWGIAVEQTVQPHQSTGRYRFVNAVAPLTGTSPCASIQSQLGAQHEVRGFSAPTGSVLVDPLLGGSIQPGTQVMVYEEVRYDVAPSGGALAGLWVRRMSGYTSSGQPNMQPLVGPVMDEASLRFSYLQQDGVTPALQRQDIRQIRVWLQVRSRTSRWRGEELQPQRVDTMTADIILRNPQ